LQKQPIPLEVDTASRILRQKISKEFWPHSTTNQPRRDVRKPACRGTNVPTRTARLRTLNSRAGGSIVLLNQVSGRTTYSGTELTASCSDHDRLRTAATAAKPIAMRGSHPLEDR
jgi:hypothetical protein